MVIIISRCCQKCLMMYPYMLPSVLKHYYELVDVDMCDKLIVIQGIKVLHVCNTFCMYFDNRECGVVCDIISLRVVCVDDTVICCVVAGDKTKAVDIPLKESIMWDPDIVNDLTEEEGE